MQIDTAHGSNVSNATAGTVTLYEPFSLTYLLIVGLIFWVSGEMYSVFSTQHERDCWRANAVMLEEGLQGPLRRCE